MTNVLVVGRGYPGDPASTRWVSLALNPTYDLGHPLDQPQRRGGRRNRRR